MLWCLLSSTISNIFSSENGQLKPNFMLSLPGKGGGDKSYINGPGHITKIALMPIYGKTSKILFSRTTSPMILKLCMQHRVLKFYFYLNEDPGLTLTYYTSRLYLVAWAFEWGKLLWSNLMRKPCGKELNDWIIVLLKNNDLGVVCSCLRAIYMSMATTFKHLLNHFNKPIQPNFMWSLLGKGVRKFIWMVQVTWLRWQPIPYMVKAFTS